MVFSDAVAYAPKFVAPGIALNQFRCSGFDEFPGQVRVLQELGHADLIHDVKFCRLPVRAKLHLAAKPFSIPGRERAKLPHPLRALGSLKGSLIVLKSDTPIIDRS